MKWVYKLLYVVCMIMLSLACIMYLIIILANAEMKWYAFIWLLLTMGIMWTLTKWAASEGIIK